MRLEACGVCHTDLYPRRAPIRRDTRTVCSAARAPASWRRLGPTSRSARRPRGHLRARVWGVPALPRSAHEPLRRDPRPAGLSASCRTARRDSPERQGHPALHGHVDLRRVHGRPRDRAWVNPMRRSPPARRSRVALDRDGCGALHGAGHARLDLRRLRLRARRSGAVIAGSRGADRIVAVDPRGAARAGRHGATDTRVAAEDVVDWIRTRPAASGRLPSGDQERPGDAAGRRGGSGGLGLGT